YRDGKLYLSFPARDGTIIKLTFDHISEDDWNRALSNFKTRQVQLVTTARNNEAATRTMVARERRQHELAREFEDAKKSVLEAQPAFQKWKNILDRLQPNTAPL